MSTFWVAESELSRSVWPCCAQKHEIMSSCILTSDKRTIRLEFSVWYADVLCSPHSGFSSAETRLRMEQRSSFKIWHFKKKQKIVFKGAFGWGILMRTKMRSSDHLFYGIPIAFFWGNLQVFLFGAFFIFRVEWGMSHIYWVMRLSWWSATFLVFSLLKRFLIWPKRTHSLHRTLT